MPRKRRPVGRIRGREGTPYTAVFSIPDNEIDPVERLRLAVVLLAMEDWRNLWRADPVKHSHRSDHTLCRESSLRAFFRSDWGGMMCGGREMEPILERIRREELDRRKGTGDADERPQALSKRATDAPRTRDADCHVAASGSSQ